MSTFSEEFSRVAALRGLLPRTVETYLFWLRKFYGTNRKPASTWSSRDVSDFIHQLHREGYSGRSRGQALCALVFAFRHVLRIDPGQLELPPHPKQRQTIKDIPTREEIGRIFAGLRGMPRLAAALMYGSGLRVEETCTLRVQDLDLDRLTVRIHGGKGNKDRLTVFPAAMVPAMRRHLAWRESLHNMDLSEGYGIVELPGRLAKKYRNAAREFRWQYLFPSSVVRAQTRWHMTPEAVGKAMRAAVHSAGITRRVTPHTLRHAFATHAMRCGNDVTTIQQLLGHERLETTATYLHADAAVGLSPLDYGPLPAFEIVRALPIE